MYTAKIDEISTLSSMKSQIDRFGEAINSALKGVNSSSQSVIGEIEHSMQRIGSKMTSARDRLRSAEQAYQACLARQRECSEGGGRVSCECERSELIYRQNMYERVCSVYEEAQRLFSSAKNDYYSLESTVKEMQRRIDSSVADAVSQINRIRDNTQDVIDVKAPVYEPSTLYKTITAATSKADSPGIVAQIAGNFISDDTTAGDAASQLAQMVIDAAPVVAKGLMEAAHRQHAFPAAPIEGVDYIINENGVPEPIRPMVSTTNEKGEKVLIRAEDTTNCHVMKLPSTLEGSFSINNGKTNSWVMDGNGQQMACIEKTDDTAAMLLNFNCDGGENLLQAVESIAQQNDIANISRWVNRKEMPFFINAGFVVREGSASARGCVVEKSLN